MELGIGTQKQRTQPNQNLLPRKETTDGDSDVSKMRNLIATDLVSSHANILDGLVKNVGFGLIDRIHGFVGKQVDMGLIVGVDIVGSFFRHLIVEHVGCRKVHFRRFRTQKSVHFI